MKEFARRREALLMAMGDGVAVIPAAPEAIRNHDVEHPYRQSSDLYYLTGFEEPQSVLLLTKEHDEHRVVMFVRPHNKEREIWDGPRAGVEGAVADFGADVAFPIDELEKRLPDYLSNVKRLHYRLGQDPAFDTKVVASLNAVRGKERRGIRAPTDIVDPTVDLHEMRLRKSAAEVKTMKQAAGITALAHQRAMSFAAPGKHEYEVEAELSHTFRANGAGRAAYQSIVGSGPNATILHYILNNRQMQAGDLLLIDAGCEFGYYASDVTRTFPVSGKYSGEQRALYEVVLASQKRAIDAVRPGATLTDVHGTAVRALVEGLVELGLLEGAIDDLIADKKYEPYYMHRTSHWLGMDVHDVGAYHLNGEARSLEEGFVLTVEPGLYIATDANVDEKWRGIGVRIEDDVLVTKSGHEVLTAAIPKEVADVEEACS